MIDKWVNYFQCLSTKFDTFLLIHNQIALIRFSLLFGLDFVHGYDIVSINNSVKIMLIIAQFMTPLFVDCVLIKHKDFLVDIHGVSFHPIAMEAICISFF